MNIAILIVSSASLVCSAGCLAIMLKGAKEATTLKTEIQAEVDVVKTKVAHNTKVVKAALSAMEF